MTRQLMSFKKFLDERPDLFFTKTVPLKEELSGNQKKTKMVELEKLLSNFDWYFTFSDDRRSYKKGQEQQDQIRKLLDVIGKDGMKLYKQYGKKNGVMEGYRWNN